MAKPSVVVGLWALGAIIGCAASGPAPRSNRQAQARPPASLPASAELGYCLSRDGVRVGEERLTITATGALWRARGQQRFGGEVPVDVEWSLDLDRVTADTVAFSAQVRLGGAERRVEAQLRGPWLAVRADGVGGRFARDVAIAPGTRILFASPVFDALLVDLDTPRASRVIRFPIPSLEPEVRRAESEQKGTDAGGARFAISPGAGLPPVALWMNGDGLPDRVRRFEDKGPALEADRDGRGRCTLSPLNPR